MNRAENPASIPIDLILEILSRLPSKSLWRTMLSCPYFKELYLTRSSAGPRLLFAVDKVGEELHFYSSPQPQIPYDKSSLVEAADYHTKFPSRRCNYASGLICFSGKCHSRKDALTLILIMYNTSKAFLGFDPVDRQFKILVEHLPYPSARDRRHITLTLRVPKLGWRSNIGCPKYYSYYWSEGICINGDIYYVARTHENNILVIVCFVVRYEEFKVIEAECFTHKTPTFINYKGKLGGINWESGDTGAKLRMWVLHDVEKQEWSSYVYPLPENDVIKLHEFTVAGMTIRGEFVLFLLDTFKRFYVFYFNPEKNTLRSVEIQGFGENVSSVKVFVDHVEDFNFF
ncbi:hypothetical protein BRARA_E00660 [Brassica rapa]|uniref:Uncharacterized protein n=1 Tax=Brassica campestris TaxID=3711 RepID=A0A397Z981_BRACM|nr:hypothetical protein BRARA_E00660 [Brassica rapa]